MPNTPKHDKYRTSGRRRGGDPLAVLQARLGMLKLAVPSWEALHTSFQRDIDRLKAASTR